VAAEWTFIDAWVLASIDDGASLSEIVAKADWINHAILGEDEFTAAVPRLVAAGLIEADGEADRYALTETGRQLHRSPHGNLVPVLRRHGEPQDAQWRLPAGAFERAVRTYLKRAARST
jgi:DNA-binding transcriptional regulator PaaX